MGNILTNQALNFQQGGFSGGMNLLLEPTRIGENEYVLGRNVRCRNDVLEPTKQHKAMDLPEGDLVQGLYSYSNFLLCFVDGKAYYSTYASTLVWTEIADFLMSTSADFIYTCAVPISTMNFKRSATSATDAGAGSTKDATVTVQGTIAGLVCQDGANQPWIIYPSGGGLLARVIKTYAQWDNADPLAREYVPVGTKMVYSNGRLYVISEDETEIYRSVTGRPLDFVVNITTAGAKGGDATTTSYAVSDSRVTCFKELNTTSLFVATEDGHCFAVTPNFDRLLWGEPQFDRTYLFKGSCLNQFSFVDILGDFGFIDSEGLRSFNAILQQQNEGRNSIFSQKIAAAFKNLFQQASTVAATLFDNYAIFSMRSVFGRVLVIYDTIYKSFVSLDNPPNGIVKQFAVVDGSSRKHILAITSDNTLYELYGGAEFAIAQVKTREWTSNDPAIELKTQALRAIFTNRNDSGEATSVCYVDGRSLPNTAMGRSQRTIPEGQRGLLYVVSYPALWRNIRTLVNLVFNHAGGVGFKVGYSLRWDNGASLTHLASNNQMIGIAQAQSSKTSNYAS